MSIKVEEVTEYNISQELLNTEPPDVSEITETNAAANLAGDIIADITKVNEGLVAEQYRLNSDLNKINEVLEAAQINTAYLMSLIKAANIITANIISTPDVKPEEVVSAVFGMQVSLAVIMKRELATLTDEQVVPVIAAVTNLLTLLEVPNPEEPVEEDTSL